MKTSKINKIEVEGADRVEITFPNGVRLVHQDYGMGHPQLYLMYRAGGPQQIVEVRAEESVLSFTIESDHTFGALNNEGEYDALDTIGVSLQLP